MATMGDSVSFFGVDCADLPRWDCSIDGVWRAVLTELRWSVKAATALRVWHRTRRSDPESARLHLQRATRAARVAENARERGFIDLLAAGQPGTFAPAEEQQLHDAAFAVMRTASDAGERLDLLWERLRQAFAALAAAGDGTGDARPRLRARRRLVRRALTYRLLGAAEGIIARFKRRQRRKAAAPEDAPRRVSRGRAPPLLSDCSI